MEDLMSIDENRRGKYFLNIKNLQLHNEISFFKENFVKNLIDKMDIRYLIKKMDSIFDELILREEILSNLSIVKEFDDITYRHCIKVSILSIFLGIDMGLSNSELYNLGYGAILHDIGKIFIEKRVLNKKMKLEIYEKQIIEQHARIGYIFLNNKIKISSEIGKIVLEHHEKFSGQGYPKKLQTKDISYLARIVSVADVYDALTSERPYRNVLKHTVVLDYISEKAAIDFDPRVVNSLLKLGVFKFN